jgi:hypothetical protein
VDANQARLGRSRVDFDVNASAGGNSRPALRRHKKAAGLSRRLMTRQIDYRSLAT